MADRYLLESGAPDGYLLEDGSGVLLLETPPPKCFFRGLNIQASPRLQWLDDQMAIKPAAATASYWNPADKATDCTLSNGDKTCANSSGGNAIVRSVTSHASGKYAFKFVFTVTGAVTQPGLANATKTLTTSFFSDGNGVGYDPSSGSAGGGFIASNGSFTPYGTGMDGGDIGIMAIDIGAGKIYISRNGIWMNSADPVAGTGGASFSVAGTLYIAGDPDVGASGNTLTIETDSGGFTPPSGYTAWG